MVRVKIALAENHHVLWPVYDVILVFCSLLLPFELFRSHDVNSVSVKNMASIMSLILTPDTVVYSRLTFNIGMRFYQTKLLMFTNS